MKKSMIYTRTGDKGMTSLVGGVRVPKTHVRLEAYGTVDELNAYVGWLISLVEDTAIRSTLQYVQHKLFSLGSYLATDQEHTDLRMESRITDENIRLLEQAIDELDAESPRWKGFILPGGSPAATACHICRTVCRRAERRILALEEAERIELDEKAKCFINRLSDYFFVLAKKLNQLAGVEEIYWDKSCK